MRTALFWVITQRAVAIPYRCFGTTYLEPTGGPQASVRDYHYSLPNNPEERSSLIHTLTTCQKVSLLHTKLTSCFCANSSQPTRRGELSYLAPLGSVKISAPYFKQCFFRGGYYPSPRLSQTPRLPVPRQK